MAREMVNADSGWSADDAEIEADETSNASEDEDTPDEDEDTPDSGDESGEDDETEEPQGKSREAKYRKRAQAAEAQRDQLATRVERMQRAEVERVAGALMADGGDLWRFEGAELASFLDADGELDFEALRSHVEDLLKKRPHLAKLVKRRPAPEPRFKPRVKPGDDVRSASWGDVLSA